MIRTVLVALLASSLVPNGLYSQTTIFGGRGLLRTQSAETVGRSNFYLNSFFSTFLQATPSASTLGKDHTLTLGLTFGIGPFVEITGLLTPYQDDQKSIWGPPGDSQLGLKFRTPFSGSTVITSVMIFAKIPTAKVKNVPFEPYSSGKLGAGALGIVTFDLTETFPLFPLKAHLNFGYMDHNIRDELFNDIEDQFLIRAGMKFPIRSTILYTEYSAEVFVDNPIVREYRYNSQRLTQGIKFLGPWDLIVDLAVDISLSRKPENPDNVFLKEYADWKIIFGINYQFFFKKQQNRYVKKDEDRASGSRRRPALPMEVHERRQRIQEELQRMEKTLKKEKGKESKEKQDDQ